jgi:hypothetical protein
MKEENFSPQDSLQLIDSMINQAKNRFNENGFLYLFWGWLILFCSVGHFVLLKLNCFTHPEIIWNSWIPAVIFQFIYLSKKKKKERLKTYGEYLISYIWVSFGICMFVLSIILSKINGWERMSSFILMLYGVPTFLSGIAMQFKPLKIGGIICWALAVLSTFFSAIYGLLLVALAIILAWIIPGYLLRKKYNAQNN